MDKQELRNALSKIEDDARRARNDAQRNDENEYAFALIVRLSQIVREDIVK